MDEIKEYISQCQQRALNLIGKGAKYEGLHLFLKEMQAHEVTKHHEGLSFIETLIDHPHFVDRTTDELVKEYILSFC